jgi:hypothetical protein
VDANRRVPRAQRPQSDERRVLWTRTGGFRALTVHRADRADSRRHSCRSERDAVSVSELAWSFGETPCIGCSMPVAQAERDYVLLGGTVDGEEYVVIGLAGRGSFPSTVRDHDDLRFWGVAHERCWRVAVEGVASGSVNLGSDLPLMRIDRLAP